MAPGKKQNKRRGAALYCPVEHPGVFGVGPIPVIRAKQGGDGRKSPMNGQMTRTGYPKDRTALKDGKPLMSVPDTGSKPGAKSRT